MAVNIDIDNIATDLNNKADKDLTNSVGALSSSAKEYFTKISLPSDKYVDLTLGASGATYTAPANGWFYFRGKGSAANSYVAFYYVGSSLLGAKGLGEGTAGVANISIQVAKGQQVVATYANINTSGDTFIRFIYAVGSESEV